MAVAAITLTTIVAVVTEPLLAFEAVNAIVVAVDWLSASLTVCHHAPF